MKNISKIITIFLLLLLIITIAFLFSKYKENKTIFDEDYCSQFSFQNCPKECKLGGSCPICADIGCHAKDYDKDWQ